MEFEKLQDIIADVLNVSKDDIHPETTFVDDLGADSLDISRLSWELKKNSTLRSTTMRLKRFQQCRMQ